MARRPIIAGNWKMNKTRHEARDVVSALKGVAAERADIETVVCPPFTALAESAEAAAESFIGVGGQDLFWRTSGAYTGQISASMLLDAGARYAIIGHSERRGRFGVPEPDFDSEVLRLFGETDTTVNLKLHCALNAGLVPIVCVGETLAERQAGETDNVVRSQTEGALKSVGADRIGDAVFAYEPVWAIGTGEVCGAAEADRVCGVIRAAVASLYTDELAEQVRIQYGGSVKPDNAAELFSYANIDGALVGGASLKAGDFEAVLRAYPGG